MHARRARMRVCAARLGRGHGRRAGRRRAPILCLRRLPSCGPPRAAGRGFRAQWRARPRRTTPRCRSGARTHFKTMASCVSGDSLSRVKQLPPSPSLSLSCLSLLTAAPLLSAKRKKNRQASSRTQPQQSSHPTHLHARFAAGGHDHLHYRVRRGRVPCAPLAIVLGARAHAHVLAQGQGRHGRPPRR